MAYGRGGPILRRIAQAILVVTGVVLISFALTRALPGDPAAYFAGLMADEDSIAQVRAELGLDEPLMMQLVYYVRDLLQGDLGMSLTTGQPVVSDLASRLPASLELTLFALLLSTLVALPLGVVAAVRQGSWIEDIRPYRSMISPMSAACASVGSSRRTRRESGTERASSPPTSRKCTAHSSSSQHAKYS